MDWPSTKPLRNAEATRRRIIVAAREEFARFGFSGARIERIAHEARANLQLIYRYFGKKEDLYIAVIEDAYRDVREHEARLDLGHLAPLEGIRQLVSFTFDYLTTDPYFVRLIMNENLLKAAFARRSALIPSTTQPLLAALKDVLSRGKASGEFGEIDPVELYIVILSLCFVHVSNRYTLGIMFRRDIATPAALRKRKQIVIRTVVALLSLNA
jgi:AcrR family transcriptional regulator